MWEEAQYQLAFKTTKGLVVSKKVISTDVSIRTPKSEDPFAGTIQDGGKLRPLTGKEQIWILESTEAKGNTECFLIQLFMLATGARIQTAGTLRLRHFANPNPRCSKSLTGDGEIFKMKTGPGTGIDTKNDKNGVLQGQRGGDLVVERVEEVADGLGGVGGSVVDGVKHCHHRPRSAESGSYRCETAPCATAR